MTGLRLFLREDARLYSPEAWIVAHEIEDGRLQQERSILEAIGRCPQPHDSAVAILNVTIQSREGRCQSRRAGPAGLRTAQHHFDVFGVHALEAALSGIRGSLATLIVSYPLFFLIWSFLLREVRTAPEKGTSGVRRWLSYLSLFVGAVTILTDVITAVYYFVEGDLTVRFLLKVLVLFVITAALFIYLMLVLRSEAETGK